MNKLINVLSKNTKFGNTIKNIENELDIDLDNIREKYSILDNYLILSAFKFDDDDKKINILCLRKEDYNNEINIFTKTILLND